MRKTLVRLDRFGLFFNLARYVSGVAWGQARGKLVMPWWPRNVSRYAAEGKFLGDVWDQFFERIDHTWADAVACRPIVSYGRTGNCCPISLKSCKFPDWYERIKPVNDASHMLGIPRRTQGVKQLIDKWVVLRPEIQETIDTLHRVHMAGRHVIGLHVRGPGRYHDGTLLLNWRCKYDSLPPYAEYTRLVAKHMRDDSVVLLGTDAGCVQEHFRARWGDRLLCLAPQVPLGEAHEQSGHGGKDPYCLGVQALIDAYLLARADVFVHGHSNMSNYIICMAPNTRSEDIYGSARDVDFSQLPEPADVDIIKKWVANDPTVG